MARLLAVEWDARGARVATGRVTGHELVLEAAWSLDWCGGDDGDEPGARFVRLAESLTERGAGRGEWLVAIPRGRAELRVLQTPPVPDDELPELVRFQAMRQFASLSEEGPLDFVRLENDQRSQFQILAASLPPSVLEEVYRCAAACHATPQRAVLRPFASASLFSRHTTSRDSELLVELNGEEADVTVLIGGQAVLVRSVRIVADQPSRPLVVEIRRTIAAAQNQFGDQPMERVTLVGAGNELGTLPEELRQALEMAVEVFDPFDAVRWESTAVLPEQRGRYAALLGMLQDEARGNAPTLDFLNPRRRTPAVDRRVRYAAFAGLAVVCAGLLAILLWVYVRGYDTRIAALQAEAQDLNQQVEIAGQLESDVREIDRFAIGDVNWLDEMYLLSERLPPAEDALVASASFNSIPTGGGQILLEGFVREPGVIGDLENKLRDERRKVSGSGSQLDERRRELPWQFRETIVVAPPDLEEMVYASLDTRDASDASDESDESDASDASDGSDGLDGLDGSDTAGAADRESITAEETFQDDEA